MCCCFFTHQRHSPQYYSPICSFPACLGKITNHLLHYFHKQGTKGPWLDLPREPVLIKTKLQLRQDHAGVSAISIRKFSRYKFKHFLPPPPLSYSETNSSSFFTYQSLGCVTETLTLCSPSGCCGTCQTPTVGASLPLSSALTRLEGSKKHGGKSETLVLYVVFLSCSGVPEGL